MVLFIVLGVSSLALAIVLNVSWIILNWRRLMPLVLGIPFFLLLIAGVALNTIFLVREVRRNERHDSFLNAVTHELKTPIASIRLYLETLQRHEVPEETRQTFYSTMLEDSERLLSTVEQVLKAGELGQHPHTHVRTEVDMGELVRDAVNTARLRHHLAEEAIALELAPSRLPFVVRGNPEELITALSNVLGNAIKYSPLGGQIVVRLAIENDAWVVVSVCDQGIGIAPMHLKRIFKRFYRVPNRNVLRMKGTGLGLFLVRSIARQHGGDAYARSGGEGKGATIFLQLPRLLSPARHTPEGSA